MDGGDLMIYVALLAGAVALFLAWRCSRNVRALKERNDRLTSQIYELRLEMHRATEAHEQAFDELRYELMRQTGNLKVTGDMTVDLVTALHPQAAAVLAGFHIGGCASCAVDGSTRLEEAIAANGEPLQPVLVALNDLVTEGTEGIMTEEQLRSPNVQLAL
jgi:hypothetical protein